MGIHTQGGLIKLEHLSVCADCLDYVILPTGYAYNRNIEKAKKGDVLVFADKKRAWVHQVVKRPLRDTLVNCLCQKIYGNSSLNILKVWQNGLKAQRKDEKIISTEEYFV